MHIEFHATGPLPFVQAGSGPAIVVLNGGNAFVSRFTRARALRDVERIGRLFPPGHTLCIVGYDAMDPRAESVDAIAELAADLIRTRFGRAVVAAISFGGLVATRVAARHPDVVDSLILIATAARYSEAGRARVVGQRDAVARGDFYAMARPFVTLFRSPLRNAVFRAGLWMRRKSLAARMTDHSSIARLLDAALTASGDMDHLAAIRARTIVIAGERDQFFDPPAVRATAAAIPGAEAAIVTGETHMLPVDRPDEAARIIDAFLRPSA